MATAILHREIGCRDASGLYRRSERLIPGHKSRSAMNTQWIEVAATSTLANGEAIEVLVAERVLAIFRHDGKLFALDGMCAHQGGPIAQGQVQNGCVTCPWHGWQYELATGIQTINRQPLMQTFEVRERGEKIEVLILANMP